METKTAIINLYKTYARVEFKFRTSDELKAELKELAWANWYKKADSNNGKIKWYLSMDLKEDKDQRKDAFLDLLRKFRIEPVIRINGIEGADENSEAPVNLAIQMKPSMKNRLLEVAERKGMSLSEFLIVCADFYIQANVMDNADAELNTSDRIRSAIAVNHTKAALVADSLGMKRSQFYSKLESNKWSDEEKKTLSVLLKTNIE